MASIFLSYSREDATRADRVAHALEGAGHSVWWDRQIGAGSRFSKEIDAALKSADLVVVLWSKRSVDSAWVTDEAAAGRDSNRLVPVLIDRVPPPLGFRQYQSIDLSRAWRGSNPAKPLLDAIAARSGGPEAARTTPAPASYRQRFGWRLPALAFAGFVVLALAGFLFFSRPGGSERTIAITADGINQPKSEELARAIALDLGRYRSGPLAELEIVRVKSDGAARADYRVDVGVSGGGMNMHLDLTLAEARGNRVLWTTALEGREDRLADLRQQAVASLGSVLTCLGDAQSQSAKIGHEALGNYLNGCGRLGDINQSIPGEEVLSLFRQLTRKAPNFAPGWAHLALLQAQSYPSVPAEEHDQLTLSARANLKRAKAIDPTLPVVYAADAYLPEHFLDPAKGLAIVEEGLERHPDDARLHGIRAHFLSLVGRTAESISEAGKARQLDPLSPTMHDSYLSALAYAGRTDAAFKRLEEAEAIWPGSTVLRQARYRLDLRYGDPRNALRLLRESGSGDLTHYAMNPTWEKFLEARIDPSPAKVEAALDALRDRNRKTSGDWGYLQALGTFGRVDEAFQALEPPEAIDNVSASTDAFFRVHMKSIYSDPRFMRLAQRLGLLGLWQTSGRWPDFCDDPKLPYDCRRVAAELGPAKAI